MRNNVWAFFSKFFRNEVMNLQICPEHRRWCGSATVLRMIESQHRGQFGLRAGLKIERLPF
jgi:hypothetical protein